MASLGEDVYYGADNYSDLKEKTIETAQLHKGQYVVIFERAVSTQQLVGIAPRWFGFLGSKAVYCEQLHSEYSGEDVPHLQTPEDYATRRVKEIFNEECHIGTSKVHATVYDIDGAFVSNNISCSSPQP